MTAPKEPVYDEHISPLMTQIIELCKKHHIHMAAQFSLGHDEEHGSTLFCTTVITGDVVSAGEEIEDRVGLERMLALRAVMYPPAPKLYAITIVTKEDV